MTVFTDGGEAAQVPMPPNHGFQATRRKRRAPEAER